MSNQENYLHTDKLKDGTKIYFRELEARDIKEVSKIHFNTFHTQHWDKNKPLIPNPTVNEETGDKLSDYMNEEFYRKYWVSFFSKTKRESRKHFAIVVEAEKADGEKEIVAFSKNEVFDRKNVVVSDKYAHLLNSDKKVGNFQSQYNKIGWTNRGMGTIHNLVRAKVFKDEFKCSKGFTLAASANRSIDFMKKQGAVVTGRNDYTMKDVFGVDFKDAEKMKINLSSILFTNLPGMVDKLNKRKEDAIKLYRYQHLQNVSKAKVSYRNLTVLRNGHEF